MLGEPFSYCLLEMGFLPLPPCMCSSKHRWALFRGFGALFEGSEPAESMWEAITGLVAWVWGNGLLNASVSSGKKARVEL